MTAAGHGHGGAQQGLLRGSPWKHAKEKKSCCCGDADFKRWNIWQSALKKNEDGFTWEKIYNQKNRKKLERWTGHQNFRTQC